MGAALAIRRTPEGRCEALGEETGDCLEFPTREKIAHELEDRARTKRDRNERRHLDRNPSDIGERSFSRVAIVRWGPEPKEHILLLALITGEG